ncbi:hypothetical protein [Corynebacterium lubricantis]|uniref:hypothetical protein n=1 Tax=Corynebacterium lubricantis TaxID=541095 RepID=UPI0005243FCB|nr:hypothetical protein [Corynebacterium lubricantis]
MRKSLIAVAAAVSLAFAGTPAATAQTSSTELSSTELSSTETSSTAGQWLEDRWDWATEGIDMMSSGAPLQGSSRIGLDWVLGSVAVTALGSLYVAANNALKQFL